MSQSFEELIAGIQRAQQQSDPSKVMSDPASAAKMSAEIVGQLGMVDDLILGKYGAEMEALGLRHSIDEIAMVFPDAFQLLAWVSMAVRNNGVVHDAAALDEVVATGPIHGHYRAHYEFVSFLDKPYRIEGMTIAAGHSPLHTAALAATGNVGSFVHASFKCADENEYAEVFSVIRESSMWLPAQICTSQYGYFTYFAPSTRLQEEHELPTMYLKPRLNARDQ